MFFSTPYKDLYSLPVRLFFGACAVTYIFDLLELVVMELKPLKLFHIVETTRGDLLNLAT
jgi:hypothetical protein